jgi:transketolase C-terminal domain/subunit
MLHIVLQAADRLADQGVRCNVFDAYTFPLEATPILAAARSAGGAILTVEDNYIGGLQAELAEAAAASAGVRVEGLTAKRIPKSAKTPEEVFEYVGVGLKQIIERATALAAR